MKYAVALAALCGAMFASSVARADSPIGISLVDPVQFPSRSQNITGFRLNVLYGNHASMTGFDLGLVNRTTGATKGLQLGAFGWTEGEHIGVQYNFVGNLTKGNMTGAQLGFLSYAGQTGIGAQLSAVSLSMGSFTGGQVGVVNYAKSVKGVQFGLVNITDNLYGIQIGLVNVAKNGFLPVFPILNFAF
jgi:hypothetical protein